MNKNNLCLHCGAQAVEAEQLLDVRTPVPEGRWHPIAHHELVGLVERTVESAGTHIVERAHALSADGMRYFGLMQVATPGEDNPESGQVIGIRNSHDKTFPAAVCCGSQIFVCDNLSFCGEVVLARRHTTNINRDLPQLAARAIGKLSDLHALHDKRVELYKQHELSEREAHDLIVRAMDARAVTATKLPKVLKEYREPSHPEFKDRNVWSLYNAFTEVSKGGLLQLPQRSDAMHGVLDAHCGLVLRS